MAQAAKPKAGSRKAFGSVSGVEVSAFVSLHRLPGEDLARVSKVLEREGFKDIRPARIILSPSAAERVASGDSGIVAATVVSGEATDAPDELSPALQAAKQRGDALKQALFADPDMLIFLRSFMLANPGSLIY